ncbi:hypothetical protein EDB83DRAFT_2440231 [Lactarius deliciosus]|nr:hypothetical protein EDB83DRAFT_2440231 [Lactarius deliciosus]
MEIFILQLFTFASWVTCALRTRVSWIPACRPSRIVLSTFLALSDPMTTPNMSSSWIETQYDPRPNPPYYLADHADGSVREADHTPSMRTVYSATPHHSHNSSRQTYTSGLYGPRPQPPPVDPIHGLPTPAMVPRAMMELEDPDAETMELDPGIDQDPIYESEFDDGHRSHGTRRFVGGFMRSLRKIPRAMKRGFQPDRRGAQTSPSFVHHHQQSPYHHPYTSDNLDAGLQEQAGNPPYGVAVEHTEGDLRYSDDPNVTPALTPSAGPSRSMSHAIRAPRTESQPTYQSLTNPASRHVSHHGSLHNAQRSSPPRTVRNPDPAPSTEEGSDSRTNGNSPRPSQYHAEPEPSPPGTSRISPLDPARRPTVTVQSPTGSPIYVEPQLADDYAGMDLPVEPSPEPSVPSQFARVGKFFRDLNSLPWVSPNVTVDFNPEDSGRGRHSHARGTGRSWYTGQLHDLDILGGGAGGSSTRRLTAPSGHSLAHAQGSSATLAPGQGGSASSSEGASTHLPAPHVGLGMGPPLSSYPPYAVPQVALPSQPLYFFPAAYPQPPPPRGPGPTSPNLADQTSPQSSGNSDPGMPRQPYFYVVAMPPAYVGGAVDPSRPMMPYGVPYPPPV